MLTLCIVPMHNIMIFMYLWYRYRRRDKANNKMRKHFSFIFYLQIQ